MPSSYWHFLCPGETYYLSTGDGGEDRGPDHPCPRRSAAHATLPASPPPEADDLSRVCFAITTETENNSDTASERPPKCGIHRHSRGRAGATRATRAGDPAAGTLIDISGQQAK